MVDPRILRLPTASLYSHLEALRDTLRHEGRSPETLGRMLEVLEELRGRARLLSVFAVFDGRMFHVPYPDDASAWEVMIEVPPADYDLFFSLQTGREPR